MRRSDMRRMAADTAGIDEPLRATKRACARGDCMASVKSAISRRRGSATARRASRAARSRSSQRRRAASTTSTRMTIPAPPP